MTDLKPEEFTTPSVALRFAGQKYRELIDRGDARKRALELAVVAVGPASPAMAAEEIALRVEAVSQRFFDYIASGAKV